MFKPLYVLVICFAFFSCKHQSTQTEPIEASEKVMEITEETQEDGELNYTIEIFENDSLGWGYDIYLNGKKFIHQPHIPSVNGLMGFNNKADALTIAELMVYKIENNIMPPSISLEDLDSLKIVINH